jgi:large subunit ribosomal protein L10
MTAHVSGQKKETVKQIVDLISKYPIIGAVNMENLPAPQLQKMRGQLREKVTLLMTKRRLIKIAIEKSKEGKKGIEALEAHLKGMPALLFTNENPFKLYKTLQKSKSSAPAKAGQTAPKDIIIPAGPTSFMPGPIIGELGALGIKCGVEGGKVAVKEDSTVVREGEKIKPKVAELLTRFNIHPMEVGLDLVATYENGIIFGKDVLAIDEDKFNADLRNAGRWAFNLAMFTGYATKDTIKPLLGKAFNEAKALGLSQNIIDEGVIDELLGKAERGMLSLKDTANIEVGAKAAPEEKPAEKAEEKPAEPPKEEKKEEPKPEPKVEEKKEEAPKPEVKEEKAVEVKPPTEVEVKKETPIVEKKETPIEVKKETPPVPVPDDKPVKPEIKGTEFPKKEEEIKDVKEEAKEVVKEIEKEAKKEEKAEPEKKEQIEKAAEVLKEEVKKEEQKAEKELASTDDKIAKMVEQTKQKAQGTQPTAEKLVEEVKEEPKKDDVPSIQDLAKGKVAPSKDIPSAHDLAKRKKEDSKDVEDLAKELVKKGTLRR